MRVTPEGILLSRAEASQLLGVLCTVADIGHVHRSWRDGFARLLGANRATQVQLAQQVQQREQGLRELNRAAREAAERRTAH